MDRKYETNLNEIRGRIPFFTDPAQRDYLFNLEMRLRRNERKTSEQEVLLAEVVESWNVAMEYLDGRAIMKGKEVWTFKKKALKAPVEEENMQ